MFFQYFKGVQAFHSDKNDFELGNEGDSQDMSRHFEGPYLQYCPCEASEQKLGKKPESELKVIDLSYCHYSICLLKTSIMKKNNIKIGRKMTKLCPFNVLVPK